MSADKFPTLLTIAFISALAAPHLVAESAAIGSRADRSPPSSEHGCLPDQFQGRMRVSDLHDSSGVERLLSLALMRQMYDDAASPVDDIEVQFKVDLLTGLMIFESLPFRQQRGQTRHSSQDNDRLRHWAVVIDIAHLLAPPSSSSSLADELALVYFIDKQSNKVWKIDMAGQDSRFGGGNRRHSLNRCPLQTKSGWQRHEIDGIDLLYLLDQESTQPLLMAMSRGSSLPYMLSDVARVAVIFQIEHEVQHLEDSLLMLEAAVLRMYLQQKNQGYIDELSSGRMSERTGTFLALIIHWLLNNDHHSPIAPVTPKACCMPAKWQGSATKAVVYHYNILDQKSGAQTMVMERLYVDHDNHAISGSFYQIVDNQPSVNYTFVAFMDEDLSHSVVVYMVDVPANVCMAVNITGVQFPKTNCLSQDVATYIGQVNFGMQLSLEGWEKSINVSQNAYTGVVRQYVAMVDDKDARPHSKNANKHDKPLATCMPVVEITDWQSPLESVSAMAMVYDAELGVPDGVFVMPPSCFDVDMMLIPNNEVNGAFTPVVSIVGSL